MEYWYAYSKTETYVQSLKECPMLTLCMVYVDETRTSVANSFKI